MAQTEIFPEKIEAYDTTHCRGGVGPGTFVLQIGKHSPELTLPYIAEGADCAVFITAFNPYRRPRR